MAHLALVQPGGTFINGYVPVPSDWAGFDAKTFAAVNGVTGGTWSPSQLMQIGGQGIVVSGPFVVWGSGAAIRTITGSRVKLGDGDWPMLGVSAALAAALAAVGVSGISPVSHVGNSRTLLTSFLGAVCNPVYATTTSTKYAALQTIAQAFQTQEIGLPVPTTLQVPLRTHNGATLSTVAVTFRVGVDHSGSVVPPKARILRVDTSGNKVPLTSAASSLFPVWAPVATHAVNDLVRPSLANGLTFQCTTAGVSGSSEPTWPSVIGGTVADGTAVWTAIATTADALGFVSFALNPATASWYDSGNVKSLVVPCDQNNVIDVTQYDYLLEIVEEQGGVGAPWLLPVIPQVRRAYSSNQVLAGSASYVTGDRILFWKQTDGTANGVYIGSSVSGTPIFRAPDLATTPQFSPGAIVQVREGGDTGDSIFQLQNQPPAVGIDVRLASDGVAYTPTVGGVQTVDGVNTTTGDLVLLKDQASSSTATSGIWRANNAGAWTFYAFPDPSYVNVREGTLNAGTNWQVSGTGFSLLATAVPGTIIRFLPLSTDGTTRAGFLPQGNIWHAATALFTNISSLAFQ